MTPAGQRARRAMRWGLGWRRELGIFAAAYLLYQVVRILSRGDPTDALANAHRVFGAESVLGLDIEAPLQRALRPSVWLMALDWVYLAAQTVALVVGLVAVYLLSRRVYAILRTTVVASWLVALPVYALFPIAPPRLAGIGLEDSVSAGTPIHLAAGSTTALFNPYAAVPSLHAGFAVALGVALALAARRPVLRAAGLIWGPLVILSVLATGNHFTLDVLAGVAAAGVGFVVALVLAHGQRAWRCLRLRRILKRPRPAYLPHPQ